MCIRDRPLARRFHPWGRWCQHGALGNADKAVDYLRKLNHPPEQIMADLQVLLPHAGDRTMPRMRQKEARCILGLSLIHI
eukprot:11822836-Alexandrium_andersonii.AAC.1